MNFLKTQLGLELLSLTACVSVSLSLFRAPSLERETERESCEIKILKKKKKNLVWFFIHPLPLLMFGFKSNSDVFGLLKNK